MFKRWLAQLVRSFKRLRSREAKPTRNADHDLALLRRVHKKKLPTIKQLWHMTRLMSGKERLLFKASVFVFVLSFSWFGVALASQYRVQVPAVGGRYVEAVVGTPEYINPLFSSLNDVDMDLARLMYSGLMRVDTKQRIVPDLAVGYTLSEDQTVYTFELRKDVLWHDGEPFTAQDVLFTFDSIQNEQIGSPLRVSFQGVSVTAPDDYTVVFTLSEPFAPFLSSLTVGILPEHVWFDISPERFLLTQKNFQPVGTGPYRFSRLTKNDVGTLSTYEMERFDGYYRQPPFIEEFVFRFYPDYDGDGNAIQALRQETVQALHFVPSDLKPLVERKHIMLHTLQLPEYTALFFNQERQPVLKDADVREALAYALDKERILSETLDGEGQIIYSPILPGFPGYLPEIERTPYDLNKANELLDANWERIPAQAFREEQKQALLDDYFSTHLATSTEDVAEAATSTIPDEVAVQIEAQLDAELNPAQTFYRKNDDGELLEIKLVTSDAPEYIDAAERIAGFWQELGVKTQLTYIPSRDLSREVLRGRLYDVLLFGVIVGSDPDQYPFWHSSQIDFPGLNLARYANSTVDTLLVEAREATTEEAQIEAYTKFQETLLADRPAIFLYMPTYTYATTDEVNGQELSRIFSPSDRFAGVIHWYIKTKGRWQFSQ